MLVRVVYTSNLRVGDERSLRKMLENCRKIVLLYLLSLDVTSNYYRRSRRQVKTDFDNIPLKTNNTDYVKCVQPKSVKRFEPSNTVQFAGVYAYFDNP